MNESASESISKIALLTGQEDIPEDVGATVITFQGDRAENVPEPMELEEERK